MDEERRRDLEAKRRHLKAQATIKRNARDYVDTMLGRLEIWYLKPENTETHGSTTR